MKLHQPEQRPYVIRRERAGAYQFLCNVERHHWASRPRVALRFSLAQAEAALARVTQSTRGDKARIVHISRMMQPDPAINHQLPNPQPIMHGIPIPDSTLLRVIEVMRSAAQACGDSGLPVTAKMLEREAEILQKFADAALLDRKRRLQEN